MRNYRGEKQESINFKSPSLMWGLGHSVLEVQVYPSNESRIEFPAMAFEINEFLAEEDLLCSFVWKNV